MCGWELVGGDSFGCLVVETGEVNGSFLMIVRLVFCSGQITSFLLFTLGIIVSFVPVHEMSAANCYIVYLISVGNVRSSAENFILPGILHIFVRQCR